MIGILYFDNEDKSGAWKILDRQMLSEPGYVDSAEEVNKWLNLHGGKLVVVKNEYKIYFIEFDKDEDATVFKLKFGL